MDRNFLEEIREQASLIFQFVQQGADYMVRPRDYGTGERFNMAEVHTLALIDKEPGICATRIARLGRRTTGAASRNIEKLYQKGLIIKEKTEDDRKTVRLYPTEKGRVLARLHQEYDRDTVERITAQMLIDHSADAIRNFLAVLRDLTEMLECEHTLKTYGAV